MAEIDGTNPLTPVWPQRPYRKIEEEGKNNSGRQEEEQEEPQHKKKKNDDDNGIHIDEYV
jgi:hypothetical protein